MTRTKHVFIQDTEPLGYMALGDASVRALAIHHMIEAHDLDAIVIPPRNSSLLPLWRKVFAEKLREDGSMPLSHQGARTTRITTKDWQYGNAAWNVFEAVMWENAFFETQRIQIHCPNFFPCKSESDAVMIYPAERTDANRVLNSSFWTDMCEQLRAQGWKINHLGCKGHQALKEFYSQVNFDAEFPPTIEGLSECIAKSSLAIGGNTGPTWTCLMSSIPQVVIETKRSPHGYWNFERVSPVLTKPLTVVQVASVGIPSRL